MATETYELTIQGLVGYERSEVVMHFQSDNVTANATLTNAESLVTSWDTNVRPAFMDTQSPDYYLDRITARRVGPGHSAVAHKQYQFQAVAGTLGGSIQTTQMCPSIFLVPPTGTKSGGRIFLPTVGNDQILNNAYVAGWKTAADTFMNAQVVNFGVSGVHWQLVIFSRIHLTSVHVLGWNYSPVIGFQRRRRSPV